MEICLDTNIIIDILRKRKETIGKLRKINFVPAITSITVAELYMGERKDENLDMIIRNMIVYPLDMQAARIAGKIYKVLKKRGELIKFRDILIGAICIRFNLPLLTKNKKHFERLKEFGLSVISLDDLP